VVSGADDDPRSRGDGGDDRSTARSSRIRDLTLAKFQSGEFAAVGMRGIFYWLGSLALGVVELSGLLGLWYLVTRITRMS